MQADRSDRFGSLYPFAKPSHFKHLLIELLREHSRLERRFFSTQFEELFLQNLLGHRILSVRRKDDFEPAYYEMLPHGYSSIIFLYSISLLYPSN